MQKVTAGTQFFKKEGEKLNEEENPDTSRPTLNDDDSYMDSEVDALAMNLLILTVIIGFVSVCMAIYLISLMKSY